MAEDTTNSPSTTRSAPPGSAVGNGPADPKTELNKLKDQAQKQQAQIDQMTKDIASIKQDIVVLESGLSEVDQIVKAYTQGIQAIGDQSDMSKFVDQKSSMAVAALGAGKAAIDKIVTDFDTDVQAQNKSIADLQTASDQASAAHATAVQTAGDKQLAYNSAKTTLSRIQAGVTDLKNLKNQLNSAEDSGNYGSMYLLVGEIRSALNALVVPTPADLQAQLSKALLELKAALNNVRDKKEASDRAQAALAGAQKKLDDAKTGRRASLLEAVKNWKPAPPQPPAPAQPKV